MNCPVIKYFIVQEPRVFGNNNKKIFYNLFNLIKIKLNRKLQ